MKDRIALGLAFEKGLEVTVMLFGVGWREYGLLTHQERETI